MPEGSFLKRSLGTAQYSNNECCLKLIGNHICACLQFAYKFFMLSCFAGQFPECSQMCVFKMLSGDFGFQLVVFEKGPAVFKLLAGVRHQSIHPDFIIMVNKILKNKECLQNKEHQYGTAQCKINMSRSYAHAEQTVVPSGSASKSSGIYRGGHRSSLGACVSGV